MYLLWVLTVEYLKSLLKPYGLPGQTSKRATIGPLVIQNDLFLLDDGDKRHSFRLILKCSTGEHTIAEMSRQNSYNIAIRDFVDWLNRWNPDDFREFAEIFATFCSEEIPLGRSAFERLDDDSFFQPA